MSDAQYKFATLYRIGGRIFTDEFRGDCCKCTKTLDQYGEHAITCGNYNNETKRRHDLIRDVIGKWAKKAGFDVILEQYGLFGLTDARKPADVLIHVHHNGETWAFDVVVKVPFAPLGAMKVSSILNCTARCDCNCLHSYLFYFHPPFILRYHLQR